MKTGPESFRSANRRAMCIPRPNHTSLQRAVALVLIGIAAGLASSSGQGERTKTEPTPIQLLCRRLFTQTVDLDDARTSVITDGVFCLLEPSAERNHWKWGTINLGSPNTVTWDGHGSAADAALAYRRSLRTVRVGEAMHSVISKAARKQIDDLSAFYSFSLRVANYGEQALGSRIYKIDEDRVLCVCFSRQGASCVVSALFLIQASSIERAPGRVSNLTRLQRYCFPKN
jgi:hypothetical protein